MSRELRPHQVRIIERLRHSLASGRRRPMVQAPTGAGKTVVAGAIVKGARSKAKRVLFVVPAISLIDQTVRSFFAEGIRDVGVIQGNHPMTDPAAPVQIASIQTLQRRAIPPFDIVVIDEAHRWFEMLGPWMAAEDWQEVPFVGLSATPWTKGLGKHYDDLIQVAEAEIVQPTGIRVGQSVLVREGPFASFPGVVEAIMPNDRVKVGVSLFGRMSAIVLDLAQVQRV